MRREDSRIHTVGFLRRVLAVLLTLAPMSCDNVTTQSPYQDLPAGELVLTSGHSLIVEQGDTTLIYDFETKEMRKIAARLHQLKRSEATFFLRGGERIQGRDYYPFLESNPITVPESFERYILRTHVVVPAKKVVYAVADNQNSIGYHDRIASISIPEMTVRLSAKTRHITRLMPRPESDDILFYGRSEGNRPFNLALCDTNGNVLVDYSSVLKPVEERAFRSIDWSNDKRYILVTDQGGGVWRLNANTREITRIYPQQAGHIVWLNFIQKTGWDVFHAIEESQDMTRCRSFFYDAASHSIRPVVEGLPPGFMYVTHSLNRRYVVLVDFRNANEDIDFIRPSQVSTVVYDAIKRAMVDTLHGAFGWAVR